MKLVLFQTDRNITFFTTISLYAALNSVAFKKKKKTPSNKIKKNNVRFLRTGKNTAFLSNANSPVDICVTAAKKKIHK